MLKVFEYSKGLLAATAFFFAATVFSQNNGAGGQRCLPGTDTFLFRYPWFPLNNAAAPAQETAAHLISEINDTAALRGWSLQTTPEKIFELYCARAYSFISKGEFDDSLYNIWITLDLNQMTDLINRCKVKAACGATAKYNNALVSAGIPGVQTDFFSFGEQKQIHTVSLWSYAGAVYYYDGLRNITLQKPDGTPLDFRDAFRLIAEEKYDSVRPRVIPEYFGPDWGLMEPDKLTKSLGNSSYTDVRQRWPSDYAYSFDSSWFCTPDSALPLGYYRGNPFLRWSAASEKITDGQKILDYIEQAGYDRNLFNWWRISPATTNAALQTLLDSLNKR